MATTEWEDTGAVSYDPAEEKYWDEDALGAELRRSFDICHGCRMCFKYCDSFPSLFSAIDNHPDENVDAVTQTDRDKVIDECFQCKLCYVNCPYTDQDNHAYDLNFPALMQRAVHVRTRRDGVPLREKVLQNADLAGRLNGGFLAPLVNATMRGKLHRRLFEFLLGIHRDKLMPAFHRTNFMKWFRKSGRTTDPVPQPGARITPADSENLPERVVLFPTCFVNYNNPAVGQDAVAVLEKNGLHVSCPEQNCCGMPGINSGDLDFAVKKMKKNVESLHPYAEAGYKILAINPTCSMTLKKEYETFLPPGEWRDKARVVGGAVMDVHEFLFGLKREDRLNREFLSTPGSTAYHVPCHLRAQNIGFRSRDIMKLIPGAQIGLVAECCGHDGTWAMKKENFEASLRAGDRAFEQLKSRDAQRAATDCPLAAIQLKQGMELDETPVHPVQILARAYRAPGDGGFDEAVPDGGKD